jgi:ATPase subunit of ABC transporter with duplicated ATPase domains
VRAAALVRVGAVWFACYRRSLRAPGAGVRESVACAVLVVGYHLRVHNLDALRSQLDDAAKELADLGKELSGKHHGPSNPDRIEAWVAMLADVSADAVRFQTATVKYQSAFAEYMAAAEDERQGHRREMEAAAEQRAKESAGRESRTEERNHHQEEREERAERRAVEAAEREGKADHRAHEANERERRAEQRAIDAEDREKKADQRAVDAKAFSEDATWWIKGATIVIAIGAVIQTIAALLR